MVDRTRAARYRPRMPGLTRGSYDIESGPITLRGPDGWDVEAFHARPESLPRGGVVVHPDIMGLRPLFTELAETLATLGLAVNVVEPFSRIDAGARADLDAAARMGVIATLDDEEQIGDLAAAADRLVVDDDVGRVSVLGFCMGGMQTFKAAASGRFDAAVAFYGMLVPPVEWQSPQQAVPLELADSMCPTLAIFGGVDPWTPTDDIDALRAAWADRRDCEIVVYPDADHGFVHDAERPTHRADDANDAWSRALAWLLP